MAWFPAWPSQALVGLGSILYFFWNFSMRPAVSISFCLPVKYGWQAEQMSTRISGFVDRVSNLFPHAQVTRTLWYFGWILSFISALSGHTRHMPVKSNF